MNGSERFAAMKKLRSMLGSWPLLLAIASAARVARGEGGDRLRLDADEAARRAIDTSRTVAAARADASAAGARVDGAATLYWPRLTLGARYVRLSEFDPPPLIPGGVSVVGTKAPAGTANPPTVALPALRFSNVLDNYYLSAGVLIPVSDYFLRIADGHEASVRGARAAEVSIEVARARAATDARVVYFAWLRSIASIDVARAGLTDAEEHARLVSALVAEGVANAADGLRASSGVASAELGVADARRDAAVIERQLRTEIHVDDAVAIDAAETLDVAPPAVAGNVTERIAEARRERLELRVLDAALAAARAQSRVARAGYFPTVAVFADALLANPNPRYLPASSTWLGTWDAGVSLSWSPNDVPLAASAGAESDARVRAIDEQRSAMSDAIAVEVQRAFEDTRRADTAIVSAKKALASAEEAHRVAVVSLREGRFSATALTDVETQLTRSRFDVLNALTDARISRARLAYAVGAALTRR
jgi:outer membrane protein TolC